MKNGRIVACLALVLAMVFISACETHEYQPTETNNGGFVLNPEDVITPTTITAVDFLLWHEENAVDFAVETIRDLGADLTIYADTSDPSRFPAVPLVFDFVLREDAMTTFAESLEGVLETMAEEMMEAMEAFGVAYPAVRFTLTDADGTEIKVITRGE